MKQKLIDQLIHRAGARFGGDGINYDGFVPSKFAELIVRECMDINKQELAFNAFERLMNKYKEHFGVEECTK